MRVSIQEQIDIYDQDWVGLTGVVLSDTGILMMRHLQIFQGMAIMEQMYPCRIVLVLDDMLQIFLSIKQELK